VLYVVLAAGVSGRMGFDKTVRRNGGLAALERIARALGRRASVLVVPSRLRDIAGAMMPRALVAANDEPSRGMTRSLHAGLQLVAADEPFGVLLGDMPAMTEATLAQTELVLGEGADVAFPVDRRGRPGHPVLFSPRARRIVEGLPDGDTLREAREHALLVRRTWVCRDLSAFLDLDVPAEWEAFGA
jgi:CTP:molybdopterin cytidylyltransferase MocA